MSTNHNALTGSELHEPKGAAGASADTTYMADGAGSGAWTDPLSPINNLNTFDLITKIEDISTANDHTIFTAPRNCTLTVIRTALSGAITVADAIISIYVNNVLQGQTVTVAAAGSGKGITDTLNLSPTIALTAGQTLEFRSDGGSTDATSLGITLTFTV